MLVFNTCNTTPTETHPLKHTLVLHWVITQWLATPYHLVMDVCVHVCACMWMNRW